MISVVLVASIALAVVLGYKTKINTGFFCIAFAYLIGCFAPVSYTHLTLPTT